MECPKCGSNNIIQLTSTFPLVYLCKDCGFTFNKNSSPWIDE